MPHDAFWLPASEHCSLYVHQWLPATPVKAVVLLAHGMAEHAGRYQRLGHALSDAGLRPVRADQRGHGRTAEQGTSACSPPHGWNAVVNDLAAGPAHRPAARHADVPARPQHGQLHRPGLPAAPQRQPAGAILSGSNFQPAALYRAARLIARLEAWRQGRWAQRADRVVVVRFVQQGVQAQPHRLRLAQPRPGEVDKYVADPLCGFRCSNQLWLDLLRVGADQPA
jgi:alpha-beta hydrolase superfamily lysophospholipase